MVWHETAMRRTYTFLLNVFFDDSSRDDLRGRVRSVAHEQSVTFTSVEQLVAALRAEILADSGTPSQPAQSATGGTINVENST
jgi:hypothetical protein